MTDVSTQPDAAGLNRPLLTAGVALLAVGGLLCMAGGLAMTAALVGAARNWMQQWDEPAGAKARRLSAQARAAAAAGASGWRQDAARRPAGDLPGSAAET